MKKLLLLLHFTFGIFHFTFSQTAPGIEWQNTIGGTLDDDFSSIDQTFDGGYILAGTSKSYISGDKTENCLGFADFWIVKIDSIGTVQWQNTVGGLSDDRLSSIQQTVDGGYILGGWSLSSVSGDKAENCIGSYDYWILKLDSTGNIQWQNTIGGSSFEVLYSIRQTTDGGYVIGGSSDSNISGDKAENGQGLGDYWVIKIDASGNIQWQNTIGGDNEDNLFSIEQTSDGGYILGGSSKSNISGDKTENNWDTSQVTRDFWIVKTDSGGNLQWQNTIGGRREDLLYTIQQTFDSGYIIGGRSGSNISGDKTENNNGNIDYWIVKTDSVGSIVWQNTIGGFSDDYISYVSQTSDSGFIIGGYSHSNIFGDKTENSYGRSDYWIVKTDSLGNLLWQKTIGGSEFDRLRFIQETKDSSYILGGSSISNISGDKTENNLDTSLQTNDYWIVKFRPDTTTGLSPNPAPQETGVVIFPNPAIDEITISIPPLCGGQVGLTVFDVMGNEVFMQQVTTLNLKLKTLNFAAGVYYVQVSNGNQTANARFVKM